MQIRFICSYALFLIALFPAASTAFASLEEALNIKERVNRFVGTETAYKSLLAYQTTAGNSGAPANQPWSGSYWALSQGSVAYPYSHSEGRSDDFVENITDYAAHLEEIIQKRDNNRLAFKDIENFSPTEKYDLYLADSHFMLSRAVWSSLKQHYNNANGVIKEWEGICHGWSSAASFVKRPKKEIVVRSLDGKYSIPFFPHDLKALATLLWANSLIQDQSIVEGLRCKTNGPARDYGSGKVLTTRCKGVNPGVWHLGLLGLMGERKKPFILNKNNDIEVWNQPIANYAFEYYNIQTGTKGKLENVATLLTSADTFRQFRSKGTVYLVGVDLNLNYISETVATHITTDSEKNDLIEKLHLRYTLELDAAFNVLGGEWVESSQLNSASGRFIPSFPGFMWRFQEDSPIAMSVADHKAPDAITSSKDLKTLLWASYQSSQFKYNRYRLNEAGDVDLLELDAEGKPIFNRQEERPQPLGKIVYQLIDLAQ